MVKRHGVEILLKAGHPKTELARLAGVSLCSVKRIFTAWGVLGCSTSVQADNPCQCNSVLPLNGSHRTKPVWEGLKGPPISLLERVSRA